MLRPHRRAATAILLPLAIALSACGSSDSDTESGDTTSTTDEGNTAAEGTGTVTVDGVEYPNFVGDCSISRGLDPETYEPIPVGDLSDPGLIVVVGIDNVVSEPEVEANFIIVSYPNFRDGASVVAEVVCEIGLG